MLKRGILICFVLVLLFGTKAYASEGIDVDYTDIENVLGDILQNDSFSFKQYVTDLITGKESFSLKSILNTIKNSVLNELQNSKKVIFQIIAIGIIAAVFTNFSNIFTNNQIAETGFFITYLLLFTILTSSFISMSHMAANTISSVINFMNALIPTYFLAIAFSAGARTSLVYYELTIIIITVANMLLLKIVIPLINMHMIISVSNNLSKEPLLTKLADFIKLIIEWSLKALLTFVIGFNTIQGLIVPIADGLKGTAINKVASLIPGAGDAYNTVTKTILGSGALVKNAMGVAGLVAIIIICAAPVLKIIVFIIIYEISASLIQPISDKRLINCINAASESGKLLLKLVFIGSLLFIITIAIISATTNARLYMG